MGLSYIPTIEREELQRRLDALMVPGPIIDHDMERRVRRLDGLFRTYAATCPAPLWAPGLVLTNEVINQAEQYLPLSEIARAFSRFCRLAIDSPDSADLLLFHDALGWLPLLEKLAWPLVDANPAELLQLLLNDQETRCRFLFALNLPKQHGGDFTRYPAQMRILATWLKNRHPGKATLSCLDAACGTGEGTWDLAGALLAAGFSPDAFLIRGFTLGAMELFAAAHAFFPHDPDRQRAYRAKTAPLFAAGIAGRMLFRQADLRLDDNGETHGVILCNGLLGGPMLHERGSVEAVVRRLAASLEPGGMLMAADRFHAGWHKVFPREQLKELLVGCGLRLVDGGEGIAGIRT